MTFQIRFRLLGDSEDSQGPLFAELYIYSNATLSLSVRRFVDSNSSNVVVWTRNLNSRPYSLAFAF